jgi:hypothetical protein
MECHQNPEDGLLRLPSASDLGRLRGAADASVQTGSRQQNQCISTVLSYYNVSID